MFVSPSPLWIQWNGIFEIVFQDFIAKYKSDKWILTLKYPTSDNVYAGGENWEAVAPNQSMKGFRSRTTQRNNQLVIYDCYYCLFFKNKL